MDSQRAPLSSRVDAPARLDLPRHPDVHLWRQAASDDIDAILEMQRLADEVDHPDWATAREDIAADFGDSHVDLNQDSIVATASDGSVLAYGLVLLGRGQETRVQSYLRGTVRPAFRGRGLGRELLRWQAARSVQQLASSDKTLPGWSMLYAESSNAAAVALGQRAGYSLARYFTSMQRDVTESIPVIDAAGGIRIVPCTPDLFEATRIARNDAFRDHWGSQPTLEERWATFTGSSQFRSDLSWVAVVDDESGPRVVGLALTTINEEDWALQGFSSGYIALIGVVRDWRGRRLAPALLARLLTSYRDAGLERALLDVDADSPTGANSLYERMGFAATTQEVALVREF